MMWFLKLALKRLFARWRTFLTLIVGVMLAAVIGANTALYTDAIIQVGLADYLETLPPEAIHIHSRTSITPENVDSLAQTWDDNNDIVQGAVDASLGETANGWLAHQVQWAESQPLFVQRDGADIEGAQARLAYYDMLPQFATLTEGDWYDDASSYRIPVVIPAAYAAEYSIAVGDRLVLDQRGWDTSVPFEVGVVGLIEETLIEDAYWASPSPLRLDARRGAALETNFFTTRQHLIRVASLNLPQPSLQIGWRLLFDHTQLPVSQVPERMAQVELLEATISRAFEPLRETQGSIVFETDMPAVMAAYMEQVRQLNIPFTLLAIQLGALVFFFLMLIAALAHRTDQREIAMLQSRGVRGGQIMMVYAIESAIICLLAFLIGPFISQQILIRLVPLLLEQRTLLLPISSTAVLYAGVAAFVAWIVLMVTLLPTLQQPLIQAGSGAVRSTGQSWWRRYYLDVVVLIIGMAALSQITGRQSLDVATGSGGMQTDPLLLLAPTLLFVAFSSVLLRLFAPLTRTVAGFFQNRPGLEGALASWQVSRDATHYGRIAFLLALAIGVGWFAISYQSTLVGNRQDQASYRVGADVRVSWERDSVAATQALVQTITSLPQVAESTSVLRVPLPNVSTSTGRRGREQGYLLAVDDEALSDVVYWRDDYADGYVSETDLVPAIPAGRELPFVPDRLGVWMRLDRPSLVDFGSYSIEMSPQPSQLANYTLQARFQTETGLIFEVLLEPDTTALDALVAELDAEYVANAETDEGLDSEIIEWATVEWPDEGWLYFEADLPAEISGEALNLIGITAFEPGFTGGFGRSISPPSMLSLANLVLYDDMGQPVETPWFNAADWDFSNASFVTSTVGAAEYLPPSLEGQAGEGQAMTVHWSDSESTAFALLLDYPELTTIHVAGGPAGEEVPDEEIVGLPVYVSRSFYDLNELNIGQRFTLLVDQFSPWFTVVDVVDMYPTLYQDTPYVVVDKALLDYTAGRIAVQFPPNELWLRLQEGVESGQFVEVMLAALPEGQSVEVMTLDEVLAQQQADIQSQGIVGLLFISFMVGLTLSIISLFTYISLTTQTRLAQFAVLRAMGLSTTRIVGILIREQALVLVIALALGAVIGQFLTIQVLPPLTLSAAGGALTPVYILKLDMGLLARFLLGLIGVLAVVLLLSAYWVQRAASAEALRRPDE
ncbi:ABC transporter permease [Phototrophicus methaneseepsis]|uniref:ABC transporter permease n=1 Tax=Phototrophicus methaneseepsis TaxID=2710758 RepID=A0A7S8IDB3_9CHLR|nr:ABC transporter permease [Phototrophicus methaneseepsis]QPC81387.1 ABC transporter permease [Phototrophicus methaneseepsis]